MEMADIDQKIRAREVQNQALAEVNAKLKSCQETLKNFEHLSERVETLPNKLSHEVMVPFGKLAFMPGRLVHTNELLVHLGDTWFASMSCKQALKVIKLREKDMKKTLSDLKKVSDNIQKKNEYLGEIKDAAEGKEFEIKEEVRDSYTHPKDRRRISRIKEDAPAKKEEPEPTTEEDVKPQMTSQYDALMARLDELERLEEEEDELCRDSENGTEDEEYIDSDDSSLSNENHSKKYVRFKDINVQEPVPCTIKVKHSIVTTQKTDDMTPADVHKLVEHKSILKPESRSTESSLPPTKAINEPQPKPIKFKETTAVNDAIIEHSTTSANTSTNSDPTASAKPVSKFKAARMKK